MRYIGYTRPENLPFKAGEEVVIPKGTLVHSMHPNRKEYTTTRDYTITVNHMMEGSNDKLGRPETNPTVRWPGFGGYWSSVDVNAILTANNKE